MNYWASARAAAGTASDRLPVAGTVTLAEVVSRCVALHPGRLAEVLAVCSVLLGDLPVGSTDPAAVLVSPGSTIEFLPPFAGG